MFSLNEAIDAFLEAQRAANRAEKTLRWYAAILYRFRDRGGRLEYLAIVHYLAARREELAPASLAGEYRALARLCSWLVSHRFLAENPMAQVDRPKEPEKQPQVAGAAVALQLAAVAERVSKYPARDKALVLVLADTGCRLGEFLQITLNTLQIVHDDSIEYGQCWIVGKGGRRRRLLIGPEAMTTLVSWIAERPVEAGACIWWSDRCAPLTEWGVRLVLRRLSKAAGIEPPIHPHAFRHGAAIDAIQAGADVRTVQLLLGHSNLSTTAKYLKFADGQLARAHDRISKARFGNGEPITNGITNGGFKPGT